MEPIRDIAVVAFAQSDHRRTSDELSEVEMLIVPFRRHVARGASDPVERGTSTTMSLNS